jgi:translation initiation factor 3 subunit E
VDYCTGDKSYFSVVQITCPELVRYLTVSIILNKTLQNNRNFDLFRLAEVINRKYVKYSDCFTEFVALLEIEYDFETAAAKVEECKKAIKEDAFLAPYEDRIVEGLHFLYFKRACKVYETIEIKEISSFTGLTADEA